MEIKIVLLLKIQWNSYTTYLDAKTLCTNLVAFFKRSKSFTGFVANTSVDWQFFKEILARKHKINKLKSIFSLGLLFNFYTDYDDGFGTTWNFMLMLGKPKSIWFYISYISCFSVVSLAFMLSFKNIFVCFCIIFFKQPAFIRKHFVM